MDCIFLDCPATTPGLRHPATNDIIGQHPGFMFGLVLVLIPLALGYVWYRRGLRPKTLDYEVIVSTSLLATASSRVRQELAVSWKGEAVDEPKLIEVMLENTGREAIVRSEYDVPITLTVKNGRLLEATVRAPSPVEAAKTDDLVVAEDGVTVRVSPKLLNANDSFVVQLVVDGFDARVSVTSRFTGQERVMKSAALSSPLDEPRWKKTAAIWVAFLVFMLVAFFAPAANEATPGSTPAVVVVLLRLLIGGAAAAGLGTFTWFMLGLPANFRAAQRIDKVMRQQTP
jgi:hypothetical protein